MDNIKFGGIFNIKCFDKNHNLIWQDTSKNLVMNAGLEHILDVVFSLGTTSNLNYYIGLIGENPTIDMNDVLDYHIGWNEETSYNEINRQEYIESRSGLSINNSASKAVFSINSSTIISGAFITSANTGDIGLLLSASKFVNGDKNVVDGNIIEVQYNFTSSN